MVAQVFEDGQCQIIGYPWGRNVSDWGGEWCGPLVPAEEVERAYREGHMEGRCGALPMAEVANEDYARSRARRVVEGEEV